MTLSAGGLQPVTTVVKVSFGNLWYGWFSKGRAPKHGRYLFRYGAAVKLEQLDFSNEQLAKALERQRLGNVLAVCQCLLLLAVLAVLLLKH